MVYVQNKIVYSNENEHTMATDDNVNDFHTYKMK